MRPMMMVRVMTGQCKNASSGRGCYLLCLRFLCWCGEYFAPSSRPDRSYVVQQDVRDGDERGDAMRDLGAMTCML